MTLLIIDDVTDSGLSISTTIEEQIGLQARPQQRFGRYIGHRADRNTHGELNRMRTRLHRWLRKLSIAAVLLSAAITCASEHHGQIVFNGVPVPGAVITLTRGTKRVTAVTDTHGNYSFPDLTDGAWKLHIEMLGFAPQDHDITVAADGPGIRWELKMLPLDQILAQTRVIKPTPIAATNEVSPLVDAPKSNASKSALPEAPKPPSEEPQEANDGFLVNGSVNNAASSQFSLAPAFGNTRSSTRGLYNGGFGLRFGNSALDARPYSLSGTEAPKSAYNQITLIASVGGPIRIPHLMPHGPNFTIIYQRARDLNAAVQSGLVPTLAKRNGIPAIGDITSINPQAAALLALYPLPNLTGSTSYNYQIPLLNSSHLDIMQTRLNKSFGQRDQVYGNFAFQSDRSGNTNLFGFTDDTRALGLDTSISWKHRLQRSLFLTTTYSYSRLRTDIAPYFANRTNVSGNAGISGNNQDPEYWGPPTLVFSSGIASLTDGISAFNRNQTNAISSVLGWYHGHHGITVGGDFRRLEFNYLTQQNPRGTFTFTGAATSKGDFADFLTGTPDTSSIAYGNADKYFRQSTYDLYATDDWRVHPDLTLNVGARWEYGAPITELKNRLVNLDITPGFTEVASVLASDPIGNLTGQHYPTSLVWPDKSMVEPRIAASWRPIAASSLVIRAGYGIYADTSIYQATTMQMAQQAPLSRSLSVQNSANCPLSLANGFTPCSTTTAYTFGLDPNFRVGYAQTWQVAIQHDFPFALQLNLAYLGIKGSNGAQEFLPNTYPIGGTSPCPLCPVGFDYRTSGGTSTRNQGSVQLRRRLRSGFTASVLYTFSKSLDDDSTLGGQGGMTAGATASTAAPVLIAQNWLNPDAERSLSSFDQRHLMNANFQYTSGMGLGGGTLLSGWRGRVFKEWTILGTLTASSGLPETPIYLAAVPGTGFTGILRPDRASSPTQSVSAGRYLNANAFTAPQSGRWGDAGRYSITGPGHFTLNTSLQRTFRLDRRWNLDVRADATNILNHAVFTSYNTTLNPASAGSSLAAGSPLFGLPATTNAMRSVQITARLRF